MRGKHETLFFLNMKLFIIEEHLDFLTCTLRWMVRKQNKQKYITFTRFVIPIYIGCFSVFLFALQLIVECYKDAQKQSTVSTCV